MRYVLAIIPLAVVLGLMIWRRWGAHRAGAAGWAAAVLVGVLGFGTTPELLWVSQAKGLLLSLFVLGVMWPALFLYHWVDQNNGITATASMLERRIGNRGMCLVLLAWALSGMLEGLAGFGLPIAVVAPMLVALKVPAVRAVTAVAVGHCWAVTFGDMGVILQTLSTVVAIPVAELVPWCSLLLGITCLLCGLLAAVILEQSKQWPRVVALSAVMAAAQYGLAAGGLVPLSAFGAGLAGMLVYLGGAWAARKLKGISRSESVANQPAAGMGSAAPATRVALACYGCLTILMALLTMVPQLRIRAQSVVWKPVFGAVASSQGFVTPAGPGQVFRPFAHPGTLTLGVVLASVAAAGAAGFPRARAAFKATVHSAGLASIGVLFMVGLSTLMEHSGMSYLLAKGLSVSLGVAYPVVSSWVGILGAFATGSNNNSNVLFGPLQKNVAVLMHIDAPLLSAAQTAGGSLGSMLAPAKIVVGCTTVGQVGQEGQVLRRTVPWGLGLGLLLGVITFAISRFR